jgi:branched-chain amino acid transport system ATP-binding protein
MSALLTVDGLRKAYRGIHAVRDASFRIEAGTITGLIGPNGSGKTTTIDCITGFQRADAGRVRLGDLDITSRSPQQIARAGMLRTFQTVRVYDDFDLMQNLLVVTAPFRETNGIDAFVRGARFRGAQRQAEARARQAIELVGLTRLIDAPAAILSYGQKKLLAIAATIMADPRLVILDEPVAGVNPSRVNEIADLLRRINRSGTTFLIVEHNVEFITQVCDHVLVLDQGSLLTQGPPQSVREDARVLDAYLGREPQTWRQVETVS